MKQFPPYFRTFALVIIFLLLLIFIPETDAAGTRITDQYKMMRDDFVSMKAKALSMMQLADERINFYDGLLCANGEDEFCPEPSEPIETEDGQVTTSTKTFLGTYMISRYYTPVQGQDVYYYGSYGDDYKINCHGDCTKTAAGYDLTKAKAFTVAACPPEMGLWTVLEIEGIGKVTCVDRGGAIKGKRIDLHAGIGMFGLQNIMNYRNGGEKEVYLITQ